MRRAVVVIALLMLVASNCPREAHAQGADDLAVLQNQVSQLYAQGKYAEAAPLAERFVALARQKHGDDHANYAAAISWLAGVYQAQVRYGEAEPLYKRSLAIRENVLGAEHRDVAQSLGNHVIVRVLAIKAFALTWSLHRQLGVDGGLGFEFLAKFQGIGYRPNGGRSVPWDYRLA